MKTQKIPYMAVRNYEKRCPQCGGVLQVMQSYHVDKVLGPYCFVSLNCWGKNCIHKGDTTSTNHDDINTALEMLYQQIPQGGN